MELGAPVPACNRLYLGRATRHELRFPKLHLHSHQHIDSNLKFNMEAGDFQHAIYHPSSGLLDPPGFGPMKDKNFRRALK